MSTPSRIRVVLFDFHNTLATCDPWLELEIRTLPGLALERLATRESIALIGPLPERIEQANAFFRELRQTVRDSGVELSAVEGTKRVLAQMGIHPPDATLEAVVAELEHECLPSVEMVLGADVTLEQLRNDGYRLGVVSSAGYPPFVEMALEMLGIRTYFSEVLTSAGEGIYKSDPEIFRRAAMRLGATPQEAIHVGDHAIYDVQAAKRAGLSAIWFIAQARRTSQLHGTSWDEAARAGEGADAIVEKMEKLPEAVERLSRERR
ncbi:MAG TPA: HAD family hydrolase [Chloroflexia bacterium]|nr:HAD family hydrolase [Chloroflexia bacterium]